MKILSVKENIRDKRNIDIVYEDSRGNKIPYQLIPDARGEFANSIRKAIQGVSIISSEDASLEQKSRQDQIQAAQDAAKQRKQNEIDVLATNLAKAIVSGNEQDIKAALVETLSSS